MNGVFLPPEVSGLVAALAIGLIVGLERGWHDRDLPEGSRVAGLRTFTLTGLLGGVLGHLQPNFGPWPLVATILGLSLLLKVSYVQTTKLSGNLSATTMIAMLLTLVLGAYASHGNITLALTAAVIVAVFLDLKPTLHKWLRLIEHRELTASLQLLVLTVVILPYLPNIGLGPYAALNPYQLWWAVILIAGLSLAGHFAMRITGSERGVFWTGLLGGLASSTATTVSLARYVRQYPSMLSAAISGTLAACSIMFFRMTVLIGVLDPGLLSTFGSTLIFSGLLLLGMAVWRQYQMKEGTSANQSVPAMSPFDLGTALGFAAFLAVTAVLVPAAKQWLDSSGIFVLSTISGFADVDAILISLVHLHGSGGLATNVAIIAIGLAVLANMFSKAIIAWTTGGRKFGRAILLGYSITMVCAGILLALTLKFFV